LQSRNIALVAVFAALTAGLGLLPAVPVPVVPVPITAQSLGVMLAGGLLGGRLGGLALLIFLILVALGLPVLAGGRGGLGVLLGPSGGFVLSWPVAAYTIGWLTRRRNWRTSFAKVLLSNVTGGIGVVYLLGIPWISITTGLSLTQAALGSVVFVPGDLTKAVLCTFLILKIQRAYPLDRL